jgi:hypothetical protein
LTLSATKQALCEATYSLAQGRTAVLLSKVVNCIPGFLIASIAHLKASAILGDPEIEVCLGAAWKVLEHARGSDTFDDGQVDVPVPVGGCLRHTGVVARSQAYVELVYLDVLLEAAIAAGACQLDVLVRD